MTKLCNWPACLTEDQQQLLAAEITQECETGKPSRIYIDKYPDDPRTTCGCVEPNHSLTPEDW